jgi:hypothetical protein
VSDPDRSNDAVVDDDSDDDTDVDCSGVFDGAVIHPVWKVHQYCIDTRR